MTPLDNYFTSAPVKVHPRTEMLKARWIALQRLSHDLQAAEMDELYRRQRMGGASEEELGLIQMWEKHRSPFLQI